MKILFTILFLSLTMGLFATDYYVSSSTGNDSNDGMSTTTAWRSVGRVNLVMGQFQAGDRILFRRGDSFTAPLEIYTNGTSNNPVVFGTYGSGQKPIIGAGISINGWSRTADANVWRSGCRICPDEIANFYIAGVPQPPGRYPNTDAPNGGYLTVDSHNGTTSLTDSQLPNFPNLVGSEVVYKPNRSLIIRAEITAHNNGNKTINFTDNFAEPTDGYGYFVQNNYATLDKNREWFWDASRSSMYLYFTGDPNGLETNATYSDQALILGSSSHVIIENLVFKNAAKEGVYVVNSANITFRNNEIYGSGTRGAIVHNTDIQFLNNIIDHSADLGLDVYNATNSTFAGNTIRNTGIIAGMGGNNYGSYTGVYISAPNSVFRNNIIENSGYDGLYFHDNNFTIRENYIHDFLLTKTGGGGIHTYGGNNSGRKILNNIVVNGRGNAAGTDTPDNYFAYGIHLNGSCRGIEMSGNSIGNIRGEGIAVRTVRDVIINNNTVYGGSFSQLTVTGYSGDPATAIRNLDVTNNIFFATEADAWVAEIYSQLDDVNQFGNWNNNRLCRPLNPNGIIRRAHHPNGTWSRETFSLDGWNDAHTHDENSAPAPLTIPAYSVDNYLTNNLLSNGNFDNNADGWTVWGPEGNYEQTRVTNQLDGGSLQHRFTSNTTNNDSYVLGISERIPAVQPGQFYLLNYSIKGVNNTGYELLFRRDGDPYNAVADVPTYFLKNTRQEMQHLFEITTADDIPRVDFIFKESNDRTWIDNVNLRRVAITPTNPANHFRFFYNPTNSNKSFVLDANYTDVYGNPHSGSLTLAPYSSMILLSAASVTALPIELFDFEGRLVENDVVLDWETGAADNFAFFAVQRSTDGKTFQTIGKTYSELDQSYFDFMDTRAAKFNTPQLYYRLKMVDTDGQFEYSPVVAIQLPTAAAEYQFYPNPTSGNLQLHGRIAATEQIVEVYNLQGQLVQTQPLTTTNLSLQQLTTGVYLVKIVAADGRVLHTERITLQR